MRQLPLFPPGPGSAVATLLDLDRGPNARFRAGSVRLAPGQRGPEDGLSAHSADEVSYIVAGSPSGECGETPFSIAAGEVSLIPAGEEHWAVVGPDGAEIFWCWYGDLDG